jgi:DNA-binding response OmpR family regulator
MDRDSGFMSVLENRLMPLGWCYRVLASRTSLAAIAAQGLDVLIVDPAVLGSRRWPWLSRLLREQPELSVIICTESSSVQERILGLRLGADDWLAKPCHPEELIARVEAVTFRRRRADATVPEPVRVGEVEVRPDQFQAFVAGRSLRLTRREYQLIEMLSRSPGSVFTREEIYETLWGYAMARNDRSVDVFIHKLRRKLQLASPGWEYIHTHFRLGYRLEAQMLGEAAGDLQSVAA